MDLRVLLQNAFPDERAMIEQVAARADARPAIVITLSTEGRRRYVVVQEDEPMFEGLVGLRPERLRDLLANRHGPGFIFGAQQIRTYGNVLPQYRSLPLREVASVAAVPRCRVWGSS